MRRMVDSRRGNAAQSKDLVLLIVVLLLIAFAFGSGILNTQKIWDGLQLEFRENKMHYSLTEGDAYGVVTAGPYLDLPAGVYRIRWVIEGDGENFIHLTCSNNAEITPAVICTEAGEWQGEAEFEVKQAAHNVAVRTEFADGSWMTVHDFRLYSPEYTDNAWTFAVVLLAIWVLLILERRVDLPEYQWQTLFVIAFAAAAVCVPCFQKDCLEAFDMQFHAARIMNLADGLKSGQFPVRVGGFSYNGYGAATSVFYPDMLLYPLALMILGGASVTYVIHFSCFAISLLSGWTMYMAAKRVFEDKTAACCAALIYICSVFRLEDMYRRYMLGEMLAMAVLPLFLWGLWEIVWGERGRWPLLTLGATLVFQSHICTTLLCAVLSVCICVVFAYRFVREKRRFCALMLAAGMTLLINLSVLIPLVMMYRDGVSTPTAQFGFFDSVIGVRELLLRDGSVGQVMWPGILAALAALALEKHAERRGLVIGMLLAGGITMFMTTRLFPWRVISALTGGLIEVIQFPWRFLVLATVFVALCGGYGFAMLMRNARRTAVLATLMISLASAWPYVEDVLQKDTLIAFGEGANPYMVYPEYQYEDTDVHDTRERSILTQGNVQLTRYEKRGTQIDAQIQAVGLSELTFPVFGFNGYAAKLNGEQIAWKRGENNRLTVELPKDAQGMLQIRYEGRMVWKIMDGVSLICAAGMSVYVGMMHRKRSQKEKV